MTSVEENSVYEQFFNLSVDMLCVVNSSGEFHVINPAFSRVLGYNEQEFISTSVLNFCHPNDINKTSNALKKLQNSINLS